SWTDQFASLRNDAADPWSASKGADGSKTLSGSTGSNDKNEPAASLVIPEKRNGCVGEQASTVGGDISSATAEDLASETATAIPPPASASPGAPPAPAPPASPAPPSTSAANYQDSRSVIEEAAGVMASRGESDAAAVHRAYLLLDAELNAIAAAAAAASPPTATQESKSTSPRPPSRTLPPAAALSRSTAEALLSWIRCSTAGNGLVIGDNGRAATSDTAERQKLWGEHAPKVLQLVKDAGQDPSSDPELQQIYTEAVMYSVVSQGIVEAFVKGKTLAFTSAMNTLAKKFPTQDNGVAFIYQGSYFLAAPWPLRNPKKARECYEKAVEINGRSRRNVYYAGLGRLECGDKKGAAEMFRRAVSDELCESASATERDIAASLREQAQRGLDACK
ncbi:unnamed protein product, partial [Hapterophycus canaliculatus]